MCGRFTLRTPANVLVRQFALGAELPLPLRYNIAPTQQVPVDRAVHGARQLALMKWGLIRMALPVVRLEVTTFGPRAIWRGPDREAPSVNRAASVVA